MHRTNYGQKEHITRAVCGSNCCSNAACRILVFSTQHILVASIVAKSECPLVSCKVCECVCVCVHKCVLQMSQFQSKQQATPAAAAAAATEAAAIRRQPLHLAAGQANDRLSAKDAKTGNSA